MATIRHGTICTKNNRRLARFYRFVFGMEEVWNPAQNSPFSFYLGDGNFQLNCLQIRAGGSFSKFVDGREVLPEVGINHIGFQIDNLVEIEKRLGEWDPPIKLLGSPKDGRYEEERFTDPDGNIFEFARGGWDAGEARGPLPAVRYISIKSPDPERLTKFYTSVLSLKEIGRTEIPQKHGKAILLADGKLIFAILGDPSVEKPGLDSIGFQVSSIAEIQERIRTSPPFLYPGEPPVQIAQRPAEGPFQPFYLKDPDGNVVDLSEQGWKL